MAQKIRVVVIGGGIAGLTAALRLAERGFEVHVLEQRVYLGGKLGAHRHTIESHMVSALGAAKQKQLGGLSQKTKAGGAVPPVVEDWIKAHLTRRSRVLNCSEVQGGRSVKGLSAASVSGAARGTEGAVRIKGTSNGIDLRFNVSLYRRADQELRVEVADDVYHEHCYHMYLNWYRNFWELMSDIGREKTQRFRAINYVTHLFPGTEPASTRMHRLRGLSAIDKASENLLSGAEPIPDMFLWFYSAADLVSHPLNPARYLDRTSVHAFMRSRWYVTERSASFHDHLLAKAFAVPTYYSSAYAYRRYIEYSLAQPEPMLWILKHNCYEGMFKAFEDALAKRRCQLHVGVCVTALEGESLGSGDGRMPRVNGLKFRFSDVRGWRRVPAPGEGEEFPTSPEQSFAFPPDYVIVAVPPAALAELVNASASEERPNPMRGLLPSLATVRKLQSGVVAVLDLYFIRKLPGVPDGHVVLRGSAYGLSFIDNSQIWEHDPGSGVVGTYLSVAATDFYKIEGMDPDDVMRVMIEDLKRFVDFDDEDIDSSRTYLQLNDGDPLFLNEVGTEPWRPETRTEIPNLFLAGDFCDNEIGIVSVEAAVVTGLRAARAVQAQARADRGLAADAPELREIPVLLPDTYPAVNADALKLLLTPHAAAAKAWSRLIQLAATPDRALSAEQVAGEIADQLAAPGAMAADWAQFAIDAAQWIAELPYGDGD